VTVPATLTVADLLATVEGAVSRAVPAPVWVRGEVTGFRRTSGGAAFFRLADAEADEVSVEVAARGRVMIDIERALDGVGVGSLRDGIEVRLRGTVGVDHRRSHVRIALLEVDPAFTAGRLAVDRAEVLRRLAADGSLHANRSLPVTLVPLRVGLVTSRGSAAHADFLHQLERSRLRFSVATAHVAVQGEEAPPAVTRALKRMGREAVDVVAVVRGGGSKLDLSAFDTEDVARAIAASPIPVLTGIGHETDRSVADEAAAVAEKTPSAAGEWLVKRVREFDDRMGVARRAIRDEARAALRRAGERLDRSATALGGSRATLRRHQDELVHLRLGFGERARSALHQHRRSLQTLEEWFATVGVDDTLRRGFALVVGDGGVVRSASAVAPGDRLSVRVADGTFGVVVEGEA
jgi:exodeoxyribonuclease VII large subunit